MCDRGDGLSALLLDLLYPPRCAGCDAPGAWICRGCRAARSPVRPPRPAHVRSLEALGPFEGPLRRAVHRMKYDHEAVVADELGAELGDLIARGLALGWHADAVVAVPLPTRRARARGFDQAWCLARAAARRAGLPLSEPLRRVRHTRTQVGLGRVERAANVRGAFASAPVAGGIVLVDDVVTTGATLAACADALRRAGARDVRVVVAAVES